MAEVEAVLAMYGDDCCIIRAEFPPHLTVHITPRTAEISSQQVRIQNKFFLFNNPDFLHFFFRSLSKLLLELKPWLRYLPSF